jgi:hypothetical protein
MVLMSSSAGHWDGGTIIYRWKALSARNLDDGRVANVQAYSVAALFCSLNTNEHPGSFFSRQT